MTRIAYRERYTHLLNHGFQANLALGETAEGLDDGNITLQELYQYVKRLLIGRGVWVHVTLNSKPVNRLAYIEGKKVDDALNSLIGMLNTSPHYVVHWGKERYNSGNQFSDCMAYAEYEVLPEKQK